MQEMMCQYCGGLILFLENLEIGELKDGQQRVREKTKSPGKKSCNLSHHGKLCDYFTYLGRITFRSTVHLLKFRLLPTYLFYYITKVVEDLR